MGVVYWYFCCQCNDGPKAYNVQPQCVICNHIACAYCKPATRDVNPKSSSANTEQSNVYRRRKADTKKEDTRQARRDQRLQSFLKDPDYTRSSAPADAESIVAVQDHSGSYYINPIAERISLALSSDYEIRVLCKNALEVDNGCLGLLQGLLKTYGEELEETPGDIYTIAGQFIRSFPGFTANAVARSLDPPLLNPEDIGESGIPQNDKADEHEEPGLLTLQHIGIEDLQRALVVGTPSEHFRHNLRLSVHPNKELGKVNYMLRVLINMPYHLKHVTDRLLRPGVKEGHMRAEWKCVCLDPHLPSQMAASQT